jgi:uncharacterized protein (TIGR02452 family)
MHERTVRSRHQISKDIDQFADDAGWLLETPYPLAIITAPAPNAGVVLARDRRRRAAVTAALAERVGRVLAIAVTHGHDALILGT